MVSLNGPVSRRKKKLSTARTRSRAFGNSVFPFPVASNLVAIDRVAPAFSPVPRPPRRRIAGTAFFSRSFPPGTGRRPASVSPAGFAVTIRPRTGTVATKRVPVSVRANLFSPSSGRARFAAAETGKLAARMIVAPAACAHPSHARCEPHFSAFAYT